MAVHGPVAGLVPAAPCCLKLRSLPQMAPLRIRGKSHDSLTARKRKLSHKAAQTSDVVSDQALEPGLVFPLGQEGSWDCSAVGSPVVQCFVGDDEERWYMWYSGRGAPLDGGEGDPDASASDVGSGDDGEDVADALLPSAGLVGVAVSSDGMSWTRGSGAVQGTRDEGREKDVGAVLGPNSGDWWAFDTRSVAVSDVQIFSNNSVSAGVGVYWMMYTGASYEPTAPPPPQLLPAGSFGGSIDGSADVEGLRMRCGLAMSQDGRHWARIEGEHHTGAMLDAGEQGEWDELAAAGPKILAAGPGDMRMYYYSFDESRGRFVVGLAKSRDGFRWEKQGVVFEGGEPGSGDFDSLGAAHPQVVRDANDARRFLMFYEGVAADGSRSIGLAVSKDGLRGWQRHPTPVLAPAGASAAEGGGGGSGSAWDGGSVGAPFAVQMAGTRWRLYYAGKPGRGPGQWRGIGLAVSGGDGDGSKGPDGGVPLQFVRRQQGS